MFSLLAVDTGTVIAIVGGAVAVVLITLLAVAIVLRVRNRRERDRSLRDRFGPEYDATIDDLGRRKGTEELERRLDEYDDIDLERVPPSDRDVYTDRWREVQFRFVDSPEWSIRQAERLVVDVMHDRGLPVDDLESRVSALSVIDPDSAIRYRDANATFRAVDEGDGDLVAMHAALLAYRETFEQLLERPRREPVAAQAGPPTDATVAT